MDAVAIKNGALLLFATIGAWIAQALGGWDISVNALALFMCMDYGTGFIVAFWFHNSPKTSQGGVSSRAMLLGFIKKIVMLMFVGMAAQLDSVLGVGYIRTGLILFFIANECLSILENGALMGITYPKFLKNALEVMREQADTGTISNADDQIIYTNNEEHAAESVKKIELNKQAVETAYKPPDSTIVSDK